MNMVTLTLGKTVLEARSSGALWLDEARLLVVSDLHLGKAERLARRGGTLLPPYECEDTLARLDAEIAACSPDRVLCLGDSFDDLHAGQSLADRHRLWLTRMMAGRDWIWIEGNHDPGPLDLGGRHVGQLALNGVTFRHISAREEQGAEVSGHYHPKARLAAKGRHIRRPAFLTDGRRLILPAFGTYTGGLEAGTVVTEAGLDGPVRAILTGRPMVCLPVAV